MDDVSSIHPSVCWSLSYLSRGINLCYQKCIYFENLLICVSIYFSWTKLEHMDNITTKTHLSHLTLCLTANVPFPLWLENGLLHYPLSVHPVMWIPYVHPYCSFTFCLGSPLIAAVMRLLHKTEGISAAIDGGIGKLQKAMSSIWKKLQSHIKVYYWVGGWGGGW